MTDRPLAAENALPQSLAIAGAWGYIGLKFVAAAEALGIDCFAFDPGERPHGFNDDHLHEVLDEGHFYQLRPDLFHLAVHPEHRKRAMQTLLKRSADERLVVLTEKPMALPEYPEQCTEIVQAVDASHLVMLYDFPELYDPLTAKILEILSRFHDVRIDEIQLCRSKDREDRSNPRNLKRMVTIQYQETVHCLAFILHLFGRLHGGLEPALDRGLKLRAAAQSYDPPNPEAYPHAVDGRCQYRLQLGDCRIQGLTDFKSGASWAKTRSIRGVGDGRPFEIEADYLEGEKWLTFNGQKLPWDRNSNSYEHVIRTFWQWQKLPRQELMQGVYPHPAFARVTYQLSSAVWRCCHDNREIRLESLTDLLAFDSGYRPG